MHGARLVPGDGTFVCEQEEWALTAYRWSTKTEHSFMHTIRPNDVGKAHASRWTS